MEVVVVLVEELVDVVVVEVDVEVVVVLVDVDVVVVDVEVELDVVVVLVEVEVVEEVLVVRLVEVEVVVVLVEVEVVVVEVEELVDVVDVDVVVEVVVLPAGANEAITTPMFCDPVVVTCILLFPAGVIAALLSKIAIPCEVEVKIRCDPVPAATASAVLFFPTRIVQQLSAIVVREVVSDPTEVAELVVFASGTPLC